MASSVLLGKQLLRNSIRSTNKTKAVLIATNKFYHKNSVFILNDQKSIANQKQSVLLNANRQRNIHSTKYALNSVTVETPAFAESIKEGDLSFLKKVGDSVKADEVIAKIETDKTTLDVVSPVNGVIEQLLASEGPIKANSKVLVINTSGGSTPAVAATPVVEKVKPKVEAASSPPPPPPPPSSIPKVDTVPSAPKVKVPIASIPVTPFKPAESSSSTQNINKIGGTRSESRVKMSKMRQTVASRLKASQNTCAMLTTFNEINMGNLVELRKSYGDAFLKKHNLKLGFMSAFVKASASALQDQPVVNAFIENNEIVYRDYVDISVAVATPKGLVVPVLRNVEKMNYAGIEREINELGEKARTNKLAIEDMQGGTFTISNGGVFGSLFGTPIINLPQSAILGMHGVFDRPIAVNGQVVIKPMMYVALTYDHRLIDGREAVTFLRKIKSAVEDPRTLLLDI